jgi:hypothetical protein
MRGPGPNSKQRGDPPLSLFQSKQASKSGSVGRVLTFGSEGCGLDSLLFLDFCLVFRDLKSDFSK